MATALKNDLLKQAWAYRQAGLPDELRRLCNELLRRDHECADAWYLLGVAALDQADLRQAQEYLARAVGLDGNNPRYSNAIGIVLIEAQQYRQAEAVLSEALSHHPMETDLLCNLGRTLMLQERSDEALSLFKRVLEIHPNHAVALFNSAVVFQSRGQLSAAVEHYQRALHVDPRHALSWTNMGAAQLSISNYAAAADAFRRALSLAPDNPAGIRGLAVASCALGQYDDAGRLLRRVLFVCPDDAEATANLAVVYQHTAQWQALRQILPQLTQQTQKALAWKALPAEQPLFNISRAADPALNLAVARAWSRSIANRARRGAPVFKHGKRPADGRITIGYLSADFRSHAVAHQAVALFELHDRQRFRICGLSVGPSQNDEYRRRITSACDLFIDLSAVDSHLAAQTIFDNDVDILVDLMGHTHQNRLDICALRPAPLQMSYLGFLASSGADFIDYLVGDPVVTPPEHASNYSEKIIQLPGCYQIISPVAPTSNPINRIQAHLPEKSFVFCCFNQPYKIDAEIFGCWMEILQAVPSSVLWLYRVNEKATANLKAAAADGGVSPDRLIFADKLPLADHLNRLRLADLALDTPLYNGGATTANALAAGIPLITTLGRHFVSRMSASHLKALGLEGLVAQGRADYKNLAVALAQSPKQLQALRQKLRMAAGVSTMFNASCFVRNLEKAFEAVWSRYRQGAPPGRIEIGNDFDIQADIEPNKSESKEL